MHNYYLVSTTTLVDNFQLLNQTKSTKQTRCVWAAVLLIAWSLCLGCFFRVFRLPLFDSALIVLVFLDFFPRCVSQEGATPLLIAAISGHPECAEFLAFRGANFAAKTQVCCTGLRFLCRAMSCRVVLCRVISWVVTEFDKQRACHNTQLKVHPQFTDWLVGLELGALWRKWFRTTEVTTAVWYYIGRGQHWSTGLINSYRVHIELDRNDMLRHNCNKKL